jgi:hypothetical protein
MKKIFCFCVVAAIAGFNLSCKKTVEKLTEFDISYSSTVSVPSSSYTPSVPVDFDSPEVPTESSSKFNAENTAKDHIDEIKLNKFNITAATGNLDAFKSISIYLKSSGMNDVLIATKTSIPAGSTTVALDPQYPNLKDYISKDKIQFRVTLTMSGGPTPEQQIKMDQTLHVKAKLLK